MIRVTMILTLCLVLTTTAFGLTFNNVTPQGLGNGSYSVVAWADVDGNGFSDLFAGGLFNSGSKLYLYDGLDWVDASVDYNVDNITNVKNARFVDFDQDGGMDLFCLTGNANGAELYHLNSNFRYQQVSLHLDDSDAGIRSATWCDADNDGGLDLLLSNRGTNDNTMVYLTRTEQEYAEERGVDGPFAETSAAQVSPVDFDRDGDMDYMITKTAGEISLWANTGGHYRNLAETSALPENIGSQSVTWADFNRDGRLDFYACGSVGNSCMFYQRAPNGEHDSPWFEDVTETYDLRSVTKFAHTAHAADFDGDGWTDIYLARSKGEGNLILLNRNTRGWHPLAGTALRQPEIGSSSSAWADFDNDGDLDCAMAQNGEGAKLFRNDTQLAHEFVALKLCGPGACTTPVLNCLVEVQLVSGKQWAATSMYASGTGSDDHVKYVYGISSEHSEEYTVSVMWPNGVVTVYDQSEIALWSVNVLHMPDLTIPDDNSRTSFPSLVPELANYPNPFNPTTNISFTLPEAANINLTVFNLLGQQVAALASGTFDAGSHSLVFDASSLTSGLYLVRLEAPDQSVVHRILLTK